MRAAQLPRPLPGWRPIRFTYEEIAFEPDEVGGELAQLLGGWMSAPTALR